MGIGNPSVMQHDFASIPNPHLQRSVFKMTPGHKTTFDAGYLVPLFVEELLPGDTLNLQASLVGRLATPLFPVMDNIFLDTFWFFCPTRLLWTNWEKFNGAQNNPGDSIDFIIPTIAGGSPDQLNFSTGSMGDYFGLPTLVNILDVDRPSALPFRMYNLVQKTWFRDENLTNSLTINNGDGPDSIGDYNLVRRGKRHDYFTSCLPWAQKGNPVLLPLGTSAPVVGNGTSVTFWDGATEIGQMYVIAGSNTALRISEGQAGAATGTAVSVNDFDVINKLLGLTPTAANSGMIADLTNATSASVNSIRQAFAFQQVLELDARGGTRYVEMLKAHFGVVSPDFRLQRPEYLGGASQPISIVSVPQTSASGAGPTDQNAKGSLAAYGLTTSKNGFHYSAVEHGYIMGIVNVRADLTYQQGMRRMWSRKTRYDFYLPTLANLGEQAVLNREIYYANGGANSQVVFGYQERWAEYRYYPSMVTGAFRSNATGGTLDSWHLALKFASQPSLNNVFIEDDPPIDRVIAVPSQPHMILDSFFDIKFARPMPMYSVPGLTRF